MEGGLFVTFTVPIGEAPTDFMTLQEEVQRETQEVEKLSRVGQSSLLTCLSKLLGKKKELQDVELSVRSQGRVGLGRREAFGVVCVGVTAGGHPDTDGKGAGPGESTACASSRLATCLPGCSCSLGASGNGQTARVPPKHMLSPDGQRVGSRPVEPSLGRGLKPFLCRVRAQGLRNSGV